MVGPALAMIDIDDIPRGLLALDALAKEAWVDVLSAGTVQDGRYLILFGGQVEPVQRAYRRALDTAGPKVRDAVLLPWAEERIAPAIVDGVVHLDDDHDKDTLGVMQNNTSPTLLRAVDAALKGALVDLIQLRVADGLGGRAIATLWGRTHDVEAAIEVAEGATRSGETAGWSTSVVRNADDTLKRAVRNGTRFFGAWRG